MRPIALLAATAFAALQTVPASAASTIPQSTWNAFVKTNPFSKCFGHFVPLEPLSDSDSTTEAAQTPWPVDPAPVKLTDAQFAKLYSTIPSKLATKVTYAQVPGSGYKGASSVEREGKYVLFSVQSPSGASDSGFMPVLNAPPQVESATTPSLAKLRASVPASVTSGRGVKICGYSVVTVEDAAHPGPEYGEVTVVFKDGLVVGFATFGGD